jgi:phosphatidate cytidylyltransferase
MAPAALVFVVAGGPLLAALAIALATAMMWEAGRLLAPGSTAIFTAVGGGGAASAIALALAGELAGAACALAAGAALLSVAVRGSGSRRAGAAALLLTYIGAAGLCLIALRQAEGAGLVAWLFILVWAADTAAFLAGAGVGRRRLLKAISPDKTWEGLLAAMGAAALAGGVLAPVLTGLSAAAAAFLGAGLAVAAQIGDLSESAFKRWLGVKDMSGLIPGHGGVLDRLDSLLAVLIIAGLSQLTGSF